MSIEIVSKKFGKGKQQHSDGVVGGGGYRLTKVTVWVLKYGCCMFSMMQAFLQEGIASIEFTKDWIQAKRKLWKGTE